MKFHYALLGMSIIFVCLHQPLQANIITMQGVIEFSSGTSPVGSIPWLTATFDDLNGQGTVNLTLTNSNLTDNEFVSGWYLNLDPVLNAGNLCITPTGKTGSFDDPGISTGTNSFKADGDGYYDIVFNFSTGGGEAERFGAGESVNYQITGISTLTANSFNWGSQSSDPNKQYFMASHVQGIGSDGSGSGWVSATTTDITTTPEPSSTILVILGLIGLALLGRRQRR